jgi:hypothetical protein
VNRWLIILGVVVAAIAPFFIAVWSALDEGEQLAKHRNGPAASEPPAAQPPPAVPAASAAPAARAAPPAAEPAARIGLDTKVERPPSGPALLGVLDVSVTEAKSATGGGSCTVSVLLPTGVELATQRVTVPGKGQFANLPTEVPLVVAVVGTGYLSGLCCDVRLGDDAPSAKRIELLPAPTVRVAVTIGGNRHASAGLRVELTSGDGAVAGLIANGEDTVTLRPPAFGVFRARVLRGAEVLVDGASVPVDPAATAQERTIDVTTKGTLTFQVLDASGAPARDTQVWLLGEFSERAPIVPDREGLAVFQGVSNGLRLAALARGPRGAFASVPVTTGGAASPRVPLLLGDPATITGDVVGAGDAAVRGASVEVILRPAADPVKVQSDDAGLFRTPPLAGGLADVVVRCDGYLDWHSERPVEIRPGAGAKIRARLTPRPTGTVIVRVRDEAGAPVAGAAVTADPSRRRGTTDASGACRFDGLPAGSIETFFARCRGYRSHAGALPSVRVPRDTAADADVVVRAVQPEPAAAGAVTATGVVVDPAGDTVAGARVTSGATVAFTDREGRFRLTGVAANAAEPVELRIAPAPSLVEPLRVLVDPDDAGLADLGTVTLRARPYALLNVAAFERSSKHARPAKPSRDGGAAGTARVFFLSSNHADSLLGAAHGAFEPVACVSYDGSWLHLPPADDWMTDGRGEVFVAFPTTVGLFTATGTWTLAPDAASRIALPAPAGPGRVGADATKLAGDSDCYRQVECATLFDPKSVHATTGEPQPPIDPFAALAAWRTFVWSARDVRDAAWEVAPGRWRVSTGDGTDRTFDVRASQPEAAKDQPPK